MAGFTKSMTDEEIKAAATYFASIPAKPWIKVVEADSVPKTRPNGGIFITLAGADAGTEPIGDRIIETPVNADDTEIRRNPRSGFIAYVPPGSLKKGEALVTDRRHRERRQGHRLHGMPWRRSARARPGAAARRPLAELHRPAAL